MARAATCLELSAPIWSGGERFHLVGTKGGDLATETEFRPRPMATI